MSKSFISTLIIFFSPFLLIAKEWKDVSGKPLGNWTFKEVSNKKIVTLENRGVCKNIFYAAFHLEDQKFIAAVITKELTKDCSALLDQGVFISKYDGRPFLFKYEVTTLPEDYVEKYDKPGLRDVHLIKLPQIPKAKVDLIAQDAPIPESYIVLLKKESSIIQTGDVVCVRGFLSCSPPSGHAKDSRKVNDQAPSVPSEMPREYENSSLKRITAADLNAGEIREGMRLPLFYHENPDQEDKLLKAIAQKTKTGDFVYGYLWLTEIKLSLLQKGKAERALKLNDPLREITEAAKKQAAAYQSRQARKDSQNRINQRRSDTQEDIIRLKRLMGAP